MLTSPPPCRSRGIALKQGGVSVAGGPFSTLNFVGASVTNDGNGQATITVTGTGNAELTDVALIPTGNPHVFLTPNDYVPTSIALYHNGRRLEKGIDYAIEESGGVGTGYDQVRLLNVNLNAKSRLWADYAPV